MMLDYAQRTAQQRETLTRLQECRAGLRPCDIGLTPPSLIVFELLDAARSCLDHEHPQRWTPEQLAAFDRAKNVVLDVERDRETLRRIEHLVEMCEFMETLYPGYYERKFGVGYGAMLSEVRIALTDQQEQAVRDTPDGPEVVPFFRHNRSA